MYEQLTFWNEGLEDPSQNKYLQDLTIQSLIEKNNLFSKQNLSAVNSCPGNSPASTNPQQKEDTKCKFSTLTIQKPGRKYDLVLKGDTTEITKLEIIAGSKNKPADISCSLAGYSAPCKEQHDKKTFIFSEKSESKENTKLQFKARASDLQWRLPWEVKPTVYKVIAASCGKSITAQIDVYQDLEIDAGFTFAGSSTELTIDKEVKIEGSGKKNVKDRNLVTSSNESTKITEEFSVKGGVKFDGITIETQIKFADIIEIIKIINTNVEKIRSNLKKIKSAAEEARSTIAKNKREDKLTFEKLNISLNFNGKWNELAGKNQVDYGLTVTLKGDPLWGLSFEIDMIGHLLKASALGLVKDLLSKCDISLLALIISAGFKVTGKIDWKIYRLNPNTVSGELMGKIPWKAKLEVLKIDINKEILTYKFSLKTEVSLSIDSVIYFGFKVDKDALKFESSSEKVKIILTSKMSTDISNTKTNRVPPSKNSPEITKKETLKSAQSTKGEYLIWESEEFEKYSKELIKFQK
ncbi:MAG: hypothetical protein ABIO79_11205 [Ferruginibacter sp.]